MGVRARHGTGQGLWRHSQALREALVISVNPRTICVASVAPVGDQPENRFEPCISDPVGFRPLGRVLCNIASHDEYGSDEQGVECHLQEPASGEARGEAGMALAKASDPPGVNIKAIHHRTRG